ncbi:MAG: hypothetical protein ACR2JU_05360 [Nocardioidaceae bacterium]
MPTKLIPSRAPDGLCAPSLSPQAPLDLNRLRRAKAAYTTRYVSRLVSREDGPYWLVSGAEIVPHAGDVVLARVHRIGQHLRIERPESRRATLFEGDEILIAYGDRYAPDQFESQVPRNLDYTNLAAAGGVAGHVIAAHDSMGDPTEIEPLGLLADLSGVLTLQRCAPGRRLTPEDLQDVPRVRTPPVVAVLGTSMNSGKTTTVASIVRGFTAAGLKVAAGKVTGTGAGGDPLLFEDSGAAAVMDFTDFGYPTTYRLPHDEIRTLLVSLISELAATAPDVIVLEVADGLFQQETSRLIDDPLFARLIDTVVFAAGEALGALAGQDLLRLRGLAPVLVSGRLTASPLAKAEAALALDVPVLGVEELASAAIIHLLLPGGTPSGLTRSEVHDRFAG